MIFIRTYGCTFNTSDTRTMEHILGDDITDCIEDADIVIFNTCGVKDQTQHKVIKDILSMKGQKRVIVAGCLPLIDLGAIPDFVDAVIGPEQVDRIGDIVAAVRNGKRVVEISGRVEHPKLMPQRLSGGTVAIIPISLGCLGSCTYCATRFARGSLRSYMPDDIVAHVADVVARGYRELQLTSQDTGCYGYDIGHTLPSLISGICEVEGRFRLRIGMMNPNHTISHLDELIEAYRSEKVFKFIHVPVQSGSDSVLKAMNRKYTIDGFSTIIERFRDAFPDIYVATDIIVGFPGETEDQFLESCALVDRMRFDKVNITRYSARPKTPAASLPQFPDRIKKDRSRILSALVHKHSADINAPYKGTVRQALVTNKGKKGRMIGRLDNYKPVVCDGEIGSFIDVRIKDFTSTYLIGD